MTITEPAPPRGIYRPNPAPQTEEGLWWCNSHGRPATWLNRKGEPVCSPYLGGIMIPCHCVFAPMILEE